MTFIASLYGRTALAAATLMSGAALLASCAGTLDDNFKEEYGGDSDGQGTGEAAATTGGGGATSATTGGDAVTTAEAATTGGDPGATTAGAGGAGGGGCPEATTIIANRCAHECHDATTHLADLELSAGWETRVKGQAADCGGNAMVLVPGDPDASLLYLKVTDAPPCDSRMPLNATALTADEMKCLYDYIAALPP